jgi:ATP synthase I chain
MTDAEKPENPPEEVEAELRPEDWQESKELGWPEVSARELGAYWCTVRRVEWMIGAAGVVCAVAVAWPLGWPLAAGLLAGTVLAWINFRWLAISVNAIGERIVMAKSQEGGAAVVAGGMGRIFLIVLCAYVTFTCSVRGFVGFLAGLAMPVVALMFEAVYEFVAVNRR